MDNPAANVACKICKDTGILNVGALAYYCWHCETGNTKLRRDHPERAPARETALQELEKQKI